MNQKMKSMNKILFARNGGAALILALLLLIGLLVFGGLVFDGSRKHQTQNDSLASAYQLFQQGKSGEAYPLFVKAAEQFSSSTFNLYRKIFNSEKHITAVELNEVIISLCLAAAYERYFNIETADEWVSRAETHLKQIADNERRQELSSLVTTASEVSKLCKMFKAGEIEQSLKKLLEIEKQALATDQDFFIFEIRMLIACGKEFDDADIINQARELLFFATTDAGINNDKTARLWSLLAD